mmetsp:Transcript_19811/g.37248  ORF Transcript_19811/g.37248 Transcript_19811/m.37248 type:complete len:202 (+) Transcript_19811:298-903(+)|eukprot:CAMPEP_0170198954 /NCGR_PEP_ID=MMETSP0040_2-20121228/69073_1 /TAXON_ID=641309 /ORGANISM="Lotharella oceanica, Strain CCMP622" /LENGTH=201 /DNA_ID=CAMNT_0010449025 /DNA_START=218 /DNA_END=823 /DNA_ORIENTATION=+
MELEPPVWGPKLIYGGIVAFVVAGIVTAIGLAVTNNLAWSIARHLVTTTVALFVTTYGVASLVRLRLHLLESIRNRTAASVYIHVSKPKSIKSQNTTGPIESKDNGGQQNNARTSVQVTKSATHGEAQLLKRLRNLSLIFSSLGVATISISMWVAVIQGAQFQAGETYEETSEGQRCGILFEAVEFVRIIVMAALLCYATP